MSESTQNLRIPRRFQHFVIWALHAVNADNPVFTPVMYDPAAPSGQRFARGGMPSSDIPRLYHSVATLTPSGDVMIAGSNPNLDRSEVKYGTEYRVEWLSPPYMAGDRPSITDAPDQIEFGTTAQLQIDLPSSLQSINVQVVLMDLGYVTHAVHANSRLVRLASSLAGDKQTLTIAAPPDGNIFPPGPGWLFVLANDIPSTGVKVMIGDGNAPPSNEAVLQNLLSSTGPDQYNNAKHDKDYSE